MKIWAAVFLLAANPLMAQETGFVSQWIERCTDQAARLSAQIPQGDSRTSPAREAIKAALGQQAMCSSVPMGLCQHVDDQAQCLNTAVQAFDGLSRQLVATFPEEVEGKPIEKQLFAEAMARDVTEPVPGSLYEQCQEGEMASPYAAMMTPLECELRRATFGHFYFVGLKKRYSIE